MANEGDDQTYIDPVPSPPRAPARPAPEQAAAAVDPTSRRRLWRRRILKVPLWTWAGAGVIAVVAVATSRGDDQLESAGNAPEADGTSPAQAGPAATPAAAPAAVEADDVRSCSLVDDDTITLDLLNNSSETSSYVVDVNYLDGAGQRIADESVIVNYVRPGEQVAEQHFAFEAADAASCAVAEVERVSAVSPDDLGEVTCEVTGVDALGDIATTLTASNGSSGLSDYFISASLIRGGVRVGSVDAVIENVEAGGSAPGDGLSTTNWPADGVTCDVVCVERTASE